MTDYVIEIERVWKEYPVWHDNPGLKEFLVNFRKFIKRDKTNHFFALKDIVLKVKRGECVGIIGKNGAGKSTLLSIMLGTVYPTKGKIKINIRATPLLEIGAGFHPDLTGRENVILNGVLLGLTKKDVLGQMDSIIDFSEIKEFIDIPVRTYSSGMYLRLAFSVAIHTDPRLLVIDEILSVGDESFQKKSQQAMLSLINGGVTTVLVSHNLQIIREICSRVLWLDHGQIVAEGEPEKIIEEYKKQVA
jgi:ABC-type polysaccharide/polyol phosphate transport system ATPase subunit